MEKMSKRWSGRLITILVMTIIILALAVMPGADLRAAESSPVAGVIFKDGATLIEQAKTLNGQKITFQGEVIGDVMQREEHAWINVLSNGTAIGIWITTGQKNQISVTGQYGTRGDIVEITGQFNQACSEHGGDLDIHANSLTVISKGTRIPQQVKSSRLIMAAVLLAIALGCLALLIR